MSVSGQEPDDLSCEGPQRLESAETETGAAGHPERFCPNC